MTDRIEIEFDPIFGARARREVVNQSRIAGQDSARSFQRSFSRGLGRSIGSLRGQFVALGATIAGALAVGSTASAAAELERIEIGFQTLLGSATLARETITDLQDFAARTPFELTGLSSATSQLLAFGIGSGEVIDRLKEIAEVASGSNADLREVATIYGQVGAAGRLTGERLLQLQERAIPIGPAIAKTLGIAEAQLRDFVSQGKVTDEVFREAFASLSQSGGLFEGSLLRQSQSIAGILSTLRDNFFNFRVEVGRTFGPAIISTANEFINIFRSFSERVASNGPELVRTFSNLAEIFVTRPAKFWSDLFAGNSSNNLAEISQEIAKVEEQLGIAERRLQTIDNSTVAGFFADVFGGREQALQDIGDLAAELTDLKARRDALTASSGENVELLRQEAQQRALANQQIEKALQLESQQAELRAKLGNIGLTREQIAQNNFASDLETLTMALEQQAIVEEEFNARKLVREQQLQDELKRIRGIGADSQIALFERLGGSFDLLTEQAGRFSTNFDAVARQAQAAAINGFGRGVGAGFAAFGAAIVNGENALKAFGQALLSTFGQALVQLGTGFILQGIAQSIAGFGSGAPLIAAGTALTVFGGALSALGGGGTGANPGTGGSPTVTQSDPLGSPGGGFIDDEETERAGPQTSVNLTVNGSVFDSEETGTRLVGILNDAFDQDGVVVRGGAVV